MPAITRRRKQEQLHDEVKPKQRGEKERTRFHWDLWALLVIENWILDFGRPIAMTWVPLNWFPLHLPSVGDYFHLLYNVLTPFCLMKLIERSPRKVNSTLVQLSAVLLVMGASIHLVGDSVNHRLLHSGYQHHLSVRENPIMQQLKPQSLVYSFEVLYFYDEVLGHYMWYAPYFLLMLLYFKTTFVDPCQQVLHSRSLSPGAWLLTCASGLYYWYLLTEGQISPLFVAMYTCMWTIVLYHRRQYGLEPDCNGLFLLHSCTIALSLTGIWVACLWNDNTMRTKYPSAWYVPEPWSYYSSLGRLSLQAAK